MFEPQHLQGASTELVQSMFKIGRTAAQLEREKLQVEIQKEKSELRRKKLEKRLKMSGKEGGRSGPTRNPKKTKREPDDDDFLEDLVVESDPKKPKKPITYVNLQPGGFVTKAEDRKGRLEKRRAKQETKDDDDDDDEEETKKDQLERETRELQSELRKTEKAAEKVRDKEE